MHEPPEKPSTHITASIEIGIGSTTSGRVIVQMTGGNEKVMAMGEAEKMLEVLKDAIRVAKDRGGAVVERN